jgi:G3E family GTPase
LIKEDEMTKELHTHEHIHEEGHEHKHTHEHGHHHAEDVFTSWGLETVKSFTKEELEKALLEIQNEEKYGNVLRAKGILASEGAGLHFDYVPGEAEIRVGSAGVIGRLCVIGCNLNEEALKELFNA